MTEARWNALILAAGRGPGDPMAKAYGVVNKCVIPVAGVPMLARVAKALKDSGQCATILVSIEDRAIAVGALGEKIATIAPAASAPASVIAAVKSGAPAFPVLVTTGDHALLTPDMVRYFCQSAEQSGADFTVGLAAAGTILAAYPQSVRTFFRLGTTRVSGCNLFALRNGKALKLLDRWQYLEPVRKKPWRLVAAFGILPLLRYLTGRLELDDALAILSEKFGIKAGAVLMPFAEAAIDVDKPADKNLAEEILKARGSGIGPKSA